MNNKLSLFDTEQYQSFKSLFMCASAIRHYTPDQHNNLIDFLSSLDINTATYIMKVLEDFFWAGYDYDRGAVPEGVGPL